jgi:hypothetical protein
LNVGPVREVTGSSNQRLTEWQTSQQRLRTNLIQLGEHVIEKEDRRAADSISDQLVTSQPQR